MFSFIPAPPDMPKREPFTRVTYGQGFRDGLAGTWRGAGLDYCQGYSKGRMRKLIIEIKKPGNKQ